MDDIVERVRSWQGVLVLRPGPGDGSPEISWGDVFFYVAPDGKVPSGQPFATIVTKDYPGEPSSGLDRPGAFRVNIATSRGSAFTVQHAETDVDPATPDVLMPHPAYAALGWVAVVEPGARTGDQTLALLRSAHEAALARWRRRHGSASS